MLISWQRNEGVQFSANGHFVKTLMNYKPILICHWYLFFVWSFLQKHDATNLNLT